MISWARTTLRSLQTSLLSAHLSFYASTTRSYSTHLANVSEYARRYLSALNMCGEEAEHPEKHQRRWRRATTAAVLAGVFFADAPLPHPPTLRAPGPDPSSLLESTLSKESSLSIRNSASTFAKPLIPEVLLSPSHSPTMPVIASPAEDTPLLPIPVFMYHNIGLPESRFQVSPQRLLQHLTLIADAGYSFVNFYDATQMNSEERRRGKYAVLTFDDGTEDHFRILPDGTTDPYSAVGVLQTFKRLRPSVPLTATFFVNATRPNGDPPFGQEEWAQYKLFQLVRMGYEIGSHGAIHESLGQRSLEEIVANIGVFQDHMMHLLPSVPIVSFAYPNGSIPDPQGQQIVQSMYSATAAAWGGLYTGVGDHNVPRIEIGPQSKIEQYLLSAPVSSPEDPAQAKRNAYKEVGVRAEYERSTSQLPPKSAHADAQPDGSGRGWRERSRERTDTRWKDGGVFDRQEGYLGRDSRSTWQQRCASRPFRDRNAWPGARPERENSISIFSSPVFLALSNPLRAYCSISSFFDAWGVHAVVNRSPSTMNSTEQAVVRALEREYPALAP